MICIASFMRVKGHTTEGDISRAFFNSSEQFFSAYQPNSSIAHSRILNPVYHLELDLHNNDGRFLYSTAGSLRDTSGKIILNLGDDAITGFTQLNSSYILAAATSRHVIYKLVLNENRVVGGGPIAGHWRTPGYAEGTVNIGKLNRPHSVVVDVRSSDRLLITDGTNNALRSMNITTGELGTVSETGFNNPSGMEWNNERLYVINNHYISEVNWFNDGSVTNVRIAGMQSRAGRVDGSFSVAELIFPWEMVKVGADLFIVSERQSAGLRLVNMRTRQVSSVCFHGESPCSPGSLLGGAYGLHMVGQDLYVGGDQTENIFKFNNLQLL